MTQMMGDVYRELVERITDNGYFVGDKSGRKYTQEELKRSGEFNDGLTILMTSKKPKKFLGVVIDSRLDYIADISIAENGDISYTIRGEDNTEIVNDVNSIIDSLEFSDIEPQIKITEVGGFGNTYKENTRITQLLFSPCDVY